MEVFTLYLSDSGGGEQTLDASLAFIGDG